MFAELETLEEFFVCFCSCEALGLPDRWGRERDLPKRDAFASCINTPQCQNSTVYITTCHAWLPAGTSLESWHLWLPAFLLILCCRHLLLPDLCRSFKSQSVVGPLWVMLLVSHRQGLRHLAPAKNTKYQNKLGEIFLKNYKTHHMMKTEKPTKTRKVQLIPIMANVQKLISPSPENKSKLMTEVKKQLILSMS